MRPSSQGGAGGSAAVRLGYGLIKALVVRRDSKVIKVIKLLTEMVKVRR
jgi:hypothetical protein